jgi:prepilin-type N-terminal cleavage/methylation domain-containing protein
MKKISRLSRSSGFTLVELLVVIAIIAILASVVLAGVSNAINAAKRVKAQNTATQIQTAVINYYTEYGVYPVPANTTTDLYLPYTDTATWPQLIIALCGNINPMTSAANQTSTISNTRQIAFLTPKRGDVDNTYGVLINPFTSPATTPPTSFNIVIDSDYSGIAGDSGNAVGTMPNFTGGTGGWTTGSNIQYLPTGVTQGVAVWACCDPKNITTPAASTSPNFWVHTY